MIFCFSIPTVIECLTAYKSNAVSLYEDLPIDISFTAGETFSNVGVFQYRDNPTVSALERLKTFAM